jgi:hypothetical protein
MTHDELVERGAKWLQNSCPMRSQIVLTEFATQGSNEIPDVIGFSPRHTNVIECKVSLADFRADLKKPHHNGGGMGDWKMYLCPAGLIPTEEVPPNWGLLYCYPKMIKIIVQPLRYQSHGDSPRNAEYHILYAIARRAQMDGVWEKIMRTDKERKAGL